MSELHWVNFVLRWLVWLTWNCFFHGLFYYDLIMLLKWCKTPYKNLDKALLFARNQVFCLKNFDELQLPWSSIFFYWNFAHVSYLHMSTKACSGFFLLFFRSWVICQNQKRHGFYTLVFYIFINNSKSKQN